MFLTDEQEQAVSSALDAIIKGRRYVIKGYAGTGKTTSLIELVRRCKARDIKICLTAPTNKAVDVIRRKMYEAGIDVSVMTTFQLLGLSVRNKGDRKVIQKTGRGFSYNYSSIIIDECSMVSRDLLKFLNRECKSFISIGDPMQLPPVNESESGSFYAGKCTELKNIIRQAANNPIIASSMIIRDMIEEGKFDLTRFKESFKLDGQYGIIEAQKDVATKWMLDSFKSKDFQQDNDKFRCLAWTNKQVNAINDLAYNYVYENPDTPFMPGQIVVLRNYSMENFHINQELQVGDINRRSVKYFPPQDLTQCYVENQKLIEAVDCWEVMLSDHENTEAAYYIRDQKTHSQNIARLREASRKDGSVWQLFFDYLDYYSDIRHPYAMTVHCSQGSTFENQFLLLDDILRNPNVKEMMQMLYVAVTRPSHSLVVM